jgi:hypothetical protein
MIESFSSFSEQSLIYRGNKMKIKEGKHFLIELIKYIQKKFNQS